ncbi:PDR/VanB family oxidoreductase [Pseudomonas sp. Fl4BN1]|uniref:PDR/VanB family oxidoreductase n=1 Tax=Pseudomonas sp. Fl4BN1 TaxID=2697651 RepID=UPI0013766B96|nr:PDR/VanB family oxidoreductase [Pseudomonas sp. Fl4BN1]NBF13429.1 2Fe-2S iron-sulfur cluster binding domain-containing protein [Pseudomonas sp. Fl4BN1]
MNLHPLRLRVTGYSAQARDVMQIELAAIDGRPLPPFTAGAHLEILLDGHGLRHYSLLNDPAERHRYVLAVGLAPDTRGGSRYLHQQLRVGDTLACSAPRNGFALDQDLERYCLLAAGIGITPILSMARWCQAQGRDWRLIYCARNQHRAAFYEVLRELASERVSWHFSDEPGGRLDPGQLLNSLRDGEHLYGCGPASLLDALQAQAGALAERLHFERFSAAPVSVAGEQGFNLVLRRQGLSLWVPPSQSILETLEAHGIQVPFACRSGICGSCETTVCAGVPEHRDLILSDAEKAAGRSLMVCVSRTSSATLELDL